MFSFLYTGQTNQNHYSGVLHYLITGSQVQASPQSPFALRQWSQQISDLFQSIVDDAIQRGGLGDTDRLLLQLYDPQTQMGFSTTLTDASLLEGEDLLRRIEGFLQSYESLYLNHARVTVKYVVRAGGGRYAMCLTVEDFLKKKKAIVEIFGDGSNCFFHCLAVHFEVGLRKKKQRHTRQTVAEEWRRKVQFPFHAMVSLEDIKSFEPLLQISFYVIQFEGLEFIYESSAQHTEQVYLLLVNQHYHYIKKDKLASLWDKALFCYACMKACPLKHQCGPTCSGCRRWHCGGAEKDWKDFEYECGSCHMKVFSAECLLYHTTSKLCEKQHRCPTCSLFYVPSKRRPHVCGKTWCKNCQQPIDLATLHPCTIQRLEKDSETLKPPSDKYGFYDFECFFDENRHVPCVAVLILMNGTQMQWTGEETLDAFCTFLFHEQFRGYTFIAHNSAKYDCHFIKQYMLKHKIESSDIRNGSGVLAMTIPKLKMRFVDSLRFIPMALRSFTKTFELGEVKKGFFPYRFFTRATLQYTGVLPALEYFEFESLSASERLEGLVWYESFEESKHVYDIQHECLTYCIDDVRVLKEGCCAFRTMFLDLTEQEVDPFQYITIASVCSVIYRRFYMPADTIGIFDDRLPPSSDHVLQAYSFPSSALVTAAGRRLCVDHRGYTVFLDCYSNGCSLCFNKFSIHKTKGVFLHELFCRFLLWKRSTAQILDHAIQELWSHDLDTLPPVFSLRDAFYGGRTEVFQTYYHCEANERIRYYDFTSLYPAVQSCLFRGITAETYATQTPHAYPVGHYREFVPSNIPRDLRLYLGIVSCEIWCPAIHIPLLPVRAEDNKLIFPTGMLKGTWTTVELSKALELGYEICQIFRWVVFEHQSSELFQGYINPFLKVKQEASGYTGALPIEAYCAAYEQGQGVVLEPANIQLNPGKRYIAKLSLNTLWGKFGQRDNYPKTVVTYKQSSFNDIVFNDAYVVERLDFFEGNTRAISYRNKNEFVEPSRYTNIAIAAFTTAYARLRLYQVLEHLQDRILYCDTDSVIFVERVDESLLCTGDYLGDLTSELAGDEWITEFVATAPKSYAYRTNKGKEECKVKGFRLSYGARQTIHFDTLKRMVDDEAYQVSVPCLQFDVASDHQVSTNVDAHKVMQFTQNKRQRRGYTSDPLQL